MIVERIKDAIILWNHNRREGSFIQIIIAITATARKRYPKGRFNDNEAFKKFLLDEMDKITGGPKCNVAFYYDGKYKVPLEEILYKIIRCQLIHEGELPQTITFTEPIHKNSSRYNQLTLYDPIGFPYGWIWNLARVSINVPENKEEFFGVSIDLPSEYPQSLGLMVTVPDDDLKRAGIDNIK